MGKNVALTAIGGWSTVIFRDQPRDEAYTVDSREDTAWVLGNYGSANSKAQPTSGCQVMCDNIFPYS